MISKMKILNINTLLDPISGGGAAERTIQMSRYLSNEKGTEVSILALNLGLTASTYKDLKGINIIAIPCINKRFYLPQIFSKRISASIKQNDVIHLMGHWTIINLIAYFWIWKYKKPYVVCPAGAMSIFGRSKILKKLYNKLGGANYIKNTHMGIAITKDEFLNFNEYGVSPKKMILLPNGIEPKSYQFKNDDNVRKKLMLGDSPFLLFVGRLNLIKGPDLLLEAFYKISKVYPDYLLIFAGLDDGMGDRLKGEVEKLNLSDRVKFLGFIAGSFKSELYHAADLLVIPSRLEAMSIVVLESAITGTPVLMTNVCGLNEMTGRHGAHAVNPDSESIAQGLNFLLSDNEGMVLRGQKLKHYVEKNFDWNFLIKDYINMYKKIIVNDKLEKK